MSDWMEHCSVEKLHVWRCSVIGHAWSMENPASLRWKIDYRSFPVDCAGRIAFADGGARLERRQRANRNHGGQPLYPRARSEQRRAPKAMACVRRLWEFGSGGPAGSHGVALLSHRRASSFVCDSFQAVRPTCAPAHMRLHTRAIAERRGRWRGWRGVRTEGQRMKEGGRSTHLTLQGEPVRRCRNQISPRASVTTWK